MSRSSVLTALVLGTLCTASTRSSGDETPRADREIAVRPELRAADVLAEDSATSNAAIESLRQAGPAGLAALLEAHRDLLEGPLEIRDRTGDPRWPRLIAALDAVGAQRDCCTSRLYWHTDLATALDAARREAKPILSLRLLGKLTDEYSCANSRYFRTSLYANHEISGYLREHFILHWQTVRPVPHVTIDFGDGRKLERTLTGNSIHWVLDSDGKPFDALPGLYGPQAFLRELKSIEAAIQSTARLDDGRRNASFVVYHRNRLQTIGQAWGRDLAELKIDLPAQVGPKSAAVREAGAKQAEAGAVAAGVRAASKSVVEFPVLRALAFAMGRYRQATTDEVWQKLGALHQADAILDQASVKLIERENPEPGEADPATGNRRSRRESLAAMVQAFEQSMAIDSVRNEYELRRQLHEWFVAGAVRDLEPLNERVYGELFLTPRTDPWLGLASPETYTGLVRGGRRE